MHVQSNAMQQTDNLTNRRRKRCKVTNKCCDGLGNWKEVEWEGGCVSQVTSNIKKHAALMICDKRFSNISHEPLNKLNWPILKYLCNILNHIVFEKL